MSRLAIAIAVCLALLAALALASSNGRTLRDAPTLEFSFDPDAPGRQCAPDIAFGAPTLVSPPDGAWDGAPVAVVAMGALRGARFRHGQRTVCSDLRMPASVDTRFRASVGTVFVPAPGDTGPIIVELSQLPSHVWRTGIVAGDPAAVQRTDWRRTMVRLMAVPILLLGVLVCAHGWLVTRNRGFLYNAAFLLVLLADLDLTHGLAGGVLQRLVPAARIELVVWVTAALLCLTAVRALAQYAALTRQRAADATLMAAVVLLVLLVLPRGPTLPPGLATALAFLLVAAQLLALVVGAARGQRGARWALAGWGPMLLVLLLELAVGSIGNWLVEALLASAAVQVFVLGTALLSPLRRLRSHRDALAARITEDPLTGIGNRRAVASVAPRWLATAQSRGTPLSAVFVDVDHFKRINDLEGHATGDAVLCAVAAALRGGVRRSDLVARIGGEEFVVLLPGARMAEAAQQAERLRLALHRVRVDGLRARPVTASFGVATVRPGDSVESLFRRADAAMYAAKRAGRDCVVLDDAVDGHPVAAHDGTGAVPVRRAMAHALQPLRD